MTAGDALIGSPNGNNPKGECTGQSGKCPSSQSMFIIRHGDRWDYTHPEWKQSKPRRPGDPSLSDLGFEQARETGRFLAKVFQKEQFDLSEIVVLVSPFLRTIQTANEIVGEIERLCPTFGTIQLKLECSVWEVDGSEECFHCSLPSPNGRDMAYVVEERFQYFPRVDRSHQSFFIPELPESKMESLPRLKQAVEAIEDRFPIHWTSHDGGKRKKQPIVVVTHAAACIGLAKAAADCELDEVNPAGPCSVFRLDRRSVRHQPQDLQWSMDHYAKSPGMNGYLGHLSDWGEATVPWNNFGALDQDERSKYTGPPREEVEQFFETCPPRW